MWSFFILRWIWFPVKTFTERCLPNHLNFILKYHLKLTRAWQMCFSVSGREWTFVSGHLRPYWWWPYELSPTLCCIASLSDSHLIHHQLLQLYSVTLFHGADVFSPWKSVNIFSIFVIVSIPQWQFPIIWLVYVTCSLQKGYKGCLTIGQGQC